MLDNGDVLPGASEVGTFEQRQMDCAGGALARTCTRSEFLATPEEATSAVDAHRADGNATPTRLGVAVDSPHDQRAMSARRGLYGVAEDIEFLTWR